jgi:hypothetical protein
MATYEALRERNLGTGVPFLGRSWTRNLEGSPIAHAHETHTEDGTWQ